MGKNANAASIPEFVALREQRQAFQEIAAYDAARGVNLTEVDPTEQLQAIHVSDEYFRLFGVPIQLGRAFTAEEDHPRGPRLVLISDGLWHRRFAADPGLLGKALLVGGEPYVVIGVLGPGFSVDPSAELLFPIQADEQSTNQAHNIRIAARLKPEVSLQGAREQMNPAIEEYRKKFPSRRVARERFTAEPLWDVTVGEVRRALLVLAGAVGFVLLIACANVANLQMARATGRKREMAVRAALGASRQRIASQLLIESGLLSIAGGALGLLLGWAGVRLMVGLNPGDIPRIDRAAALDWTVLTFTLLLAVCSGMVFGVLPAFSSASQTHAGDALKESRSCGGPALRQRRARSILVVVEVALALILLAGAGLLIRTFWALRTVNAGFDRHNVLTVEMSLSGAPFQTTAALAQLIRVAEQRIHALPGVTALAATLSLPLNANQLGGPFAVDGLPDDNFGTKICFISRRYFDVFRIPLVRGRVFSDRDDEKAPAVALINLALAEGRNRGMKWSSPFPWRNGDPLTERVTMFKGMGPPLQDRARQIVGVVGEVRDSGLNYNPGPMIYLPLAQMSDVMTRFSTGSLPIKWTIRTGTEPFAVKADIERELRAASGGLPVAHFRSMDQVVAEATARDRFNMILLSAFAALALLLGAIGVYGVMSYAVQYRTQEIGIRIALGARPQDVRQMVVFEGMRLALYGVLAGIAGALEITPLMGSLLFGVQASNPAVLVSVVILLSVVATLATYIPARRATRVDPVQALRFE
jgi:predicted permease